MKRFATSRFESHFFDDHSSLRKPSCKCNDRARKKKIVPLRRARKSTDDFFLSVTIIAKICNWVVLRYERLFVEKMATLMPRGRPQTKNFLHFSQTFLLTSAVPFGTIRFVAGQNGHFLEPAITKTNTLQGAT